MKIAIPTRNQLVDDHFGHCEQYTIYSISADKKIEEEEVYAAPRGCGCHSDIAGILRQKGVSVMLAGNMGQGAVSKITAAGIDLYRGCSGQVKEIAESFLRNEITDSGTMCNPHHNEGHQCAHN